MTMYRPAQRPPGAAVDRRRTAASVRRRAMATAVGLAATLGGAAPAVATLGSAAPAVAAPAAHATDKTPILLVHGFDETLHSKIDCGDRVEMTWAKGLRHSGFTNVRTVGFYAGDAHCADNVPDRADNTVNTSIHELGRDLANLIYTRYTRHHRPVAVSAHSMGGLVVRAALDGVATHQPGFPAHLRITDVVTSGTPHAGTGEATRCAATIVECAQMVPESRFLHRLGHNPQGVGSTDWTLVGSSGDEVVPARSAVAMHQVSTRRPAISKVIYQRYAHLQLVTEPVPLHRIATGLRTAS